MPRLLAVIAAVVATAIASPCSAANGAKPTVVCESDASGQALRCREAWPGEDAAPFRRMAPTPTAPTGAAAKPAQALLAAPPSRAPATRSAPDYLRGGQGDPANAAPPPPAVAATPSPPSNTTSTVAAAPAPVGPQMRAPAAPIPASVGRRDGDAVVKETTPPAPAAAPATPTKATSTPAASANASHPSPATPSSVVAVPAPATATRPPQPPHAAVTAAAATSAALAEEPVITTPAASTAVAESPSPTAAEPAVAAASIPAVALLGQREFAALDGSRYTLELANARSPVPLRELAARLALDGAVYLVHLRNPDADRWLLVWSDHASQAEARNARRLVPADPAINSGWPRRLGPLQNELVTP